MASEHASAPASPVSRDDFASLYAGCHLELLRYVLTLVPDRHAAEDLVQETARLLWRKFDAYDTSRPFWPWARRFAHFEVLKFRKRQSARERCYFSDELIEQLAAERAAQDETLSAQREALARCMAQLDADARALLVMRYARDGSVQRLAEQHGKTPNALSLTLHRIRLQLVTCVNRALRVEGWS